MSVKSSVLVAASDVSHRARLESLLAQAGYSAVLAASGREAVRLWIDEAFDVCVACDVHDMSLWNLCQELDSEVRSRRPDNAPPILVLSERCDSDAVERCIRAGAIDCIAGEKQPEASALLSRIAAALRSRREPTWPDEQRTEEEIRIGDMVINLAKFRVSVGKQSFDLTRLQFHLLNAMARRPGWVFTPSQLRGAIAKHGGHPVESSVKSHIYHLRRRLGPAAHHIRTVRGVGYKVCE